MGDAGLAGAAAGASDIGFAAATRAGDLLRWTVATDETDPIRPRAATAADCRDGVTDLSLDDPPGIFCL